MKSGRYDTRRSITPEPWPQQDHFSTNHPPYPRSTGGYFPGGKAAGAWSWPLTFI